MFNLIIKGSKLKRALEYMSYINDNCRKNAVEPLFRWLSKICTKKKTVTDVQTFIVSFENTPIKWTEKGERQTNNNEKKMFARHIAIQINESIVHS